ncbi:hypothetical protein BH20VER3_BH20VER3_12710 [soil metagenome]
MKGPPEDSGRFPSRNPRLDKFPLRVFTHVFTHLWGIGTMKFLILLIFLIFTATFAICSHVPLVDRWEASFRTGMSVSKGDLLPTGAHGGEGMAVLKEACALPDSAYRGQ